MRYTQSAPKWVQASKDEHATHDRTQVNVTAHGEEIKMCRLEWQDPLGDDSKSDVLVRNS